MFLTAAGEQVGKEFDCEKHRWMCDIEKDHLPEELFLAVKVSSWCWIKILLWQKWGVYQQCAFFLSSTPVHHSQCPSIRIAFKPLYFSLVTVAIPTVLYSSKPFCIPWTQIPPKSCLINKTWPFSFWTYSSFLMLHREREHTRHRSHSSSSSL